MICPKCRKQIPDNSMECPSCGLKIDHRSQLPKEISARRYQRWFFYGLISFMFIGMIVTIAKIYSVNTKLMSDMILAQSDLKKKAEALDTAKSELATSSDKMAELEKNLTEAQKEIADKTDKYKEVLFEKNNLDEKYEAERNSKAGMTKSIRECESKLSENDAMVYKMIVALGSGISNNNLKKIPVGNGNLKGEDTDGDGLSDTIETALGTDKALSDMDGDGYDDKKEVLGGFNPGGPGSMPIDMEFAKAQRGKILLQVERGGAAWYVNPKDSKKYFLGRPGEALKVLSSLK